MCRLDGSLLHAFCNYQLYDNRYQPQPIFQCLNPKIDWRAIEEQYFASEHEAIYIDGFLSQEALNAFYNYALFAKVWNKEYKSCYLGAFGNQGFISPLHLQLAVELKKSMPRIYKDYLLSQMWGFKYDSQLGKGINVHADFAEKYCGSNRGKRKCRRPFSLGAMGFTQKIATDHASKSRSRGSLTGQTSRSSKSRCSTRCK
jgi:hypothetical protein